MAPAQREDVTFTAGALDALYAAAEASLLRPGLREGEMGRGRGEPGNGGGRQHGGPEAEGELAVGFFGSRYERATVSERQYMRAMAATGDDRCRRRWWPTNSGASCPACHRPGTG